MSGPIITIVGSFAVGMTIRAIRMPVLGETLFGTDFDMGPGGKGSNQAVGVARLGARAYFAGIIGNDKLGEIATDLYLKENVNTKYLTKTDKQATGVGFIILNEKGENSIILDMGANKLMDAGFVDKIEQQIAESELVMSVLELPLEAASRAMELGKKHNKCTVLNPAPAVKLDETILKNVDYLTPNETEMRILLGLAPDDQTPNKELAKRLQSLGVKNLIVTRGKEGALVVTENDLFEVSGISVDVVDTTGAGDAFNSGLAVALAEGKDLEYAVKFANCAGAIECKGLGVIPAMGNRESVEDLYNQVYG
ncbi:MAG: ribokinase [Anaerolineaceae bacterium]|nr:ribokinase [Anaerolineaceae bacterium]